MVIAEFVASLSTNWIIGLTSFLWFVITLFLVFCGYILYNYYLRKNPIDLDVFTFTGGKPLRRLYRAKIVNIEGYGEYIKFGAKQYAPRFDNDWFIPSFRGRIYLPVISKDGYFYNFAIKDIKNITEEEKQYLQNNYRQFPQVYTEKIQNPIPYTDRSWSLQFNQMVMTRTAKKTSFWSHPVVLALAIAVPVMIVCIVMIVITKEYSADIVAQFAEEAGKNIADRLSEQIGGGPPT